MLARYANVLSSSQENTVHFPAWVFNKYSWKVNSINGRVLPLLLNFPWYCWMGNGKNTLMHIWLYRKLCYSHDGYYTVMMGFYLVHVLTSIAPTVLIIYINNMLSNCIEYFVFELRWENLFRSMRWRRKTLPQVHAQSSVCLWRDDCSPGKRGSRPVFLCEGSQTYGAEQQLGCASNFEEWQSEYKALATRFVETS